MRERVAHVLVPAPHHVGPDGPEWAWHGVFGDTVRLIGVPAADDAPATVALYIRENFAALSEAIGYVSPAAAREVAGAAVAAAETAEGRGHPMARAPERGRHAVNNPGSAVHPTKNEPAEPGLPEQSADHSQGRTPMVRTTRRALATAARRLARREPSGRVSYTPRELNELIGGVAAREVAGRLRERAGWHREAAAVVGTDHPDVAAWHRDEATALDELATRELRGQEG